MAQAARLSLRMQKELKLLLSDPPPGATFPLLSPDSNLSLPSLSSIDAQIEGPEDTVYAKGIFKIKIQIPERYPFQPPILTFATPIYHPNIDNGGRICLDILNLPPKGAWQPSLNISTVLTSIGLLLSEPNPDDGLMCEASKEYKYNRQAFDQKARSMAQKYARAGGSGNDCGDQGSQAPLNPSMMAVKKPDVSQCAVNDYFSSHTKLGGISRKLSLESSGSSQKRDGDKGVNEEPIHNLLENQMEIEGSKDNAKLSCNEDYHNHEKLHVTRRKLSLGSVGSSQTLVFDDKDIRVQQDLSSRSKKDSINTSSKKLCLAEQNFHLGQLDNDSDGEADIVLSPPQSHSIVPNRALSVPQDVKCNEIQPQKDSIDGLGMCFKNTGNKKLGLASKKLSLRLSGSLKSQEKYENNENVPPMQSNNDNIVVNLHSDKFAKTPSKSHSVLEDFRVVEKRQSNPNHGETFSPSEVSPILESVIVLDSEDSEEEKNEPMRPKMLLARKRLAGKWRAKS